MNAAVCMLDEAAAQYGSRVALEDETEVLTYAQYRARALSIATALWNRGSGRKPIIMYLPKSAAMVCAFMGAQYAGGYAPATAFALFYGFLGSLVSTRRWGALYPPLAGSILFPLEGAPQPGKAACALAALGVMTALGVLWITKARDRSGERPPVPGKRRA